MSDSATHGLQHTRLLCPPLSWRVCSNLYPLVRWCYLTISSSAASFSFCLQSFPASRYPSWITALSRQRGLHNSMKLWAMLWRATQDRQITVKSPDKTWSTEGRNANSIQYSCLAAAAAAAAKSLQSCLTLCDPIDGSSPGSPNLGFSRQEHWSGLPFPSPMHESEKWKWSRSVVSDS